ncbi:hypothetical protein Mal48_06040 [Thalassoglobus polymorphus]|uniref:Uncharacterized protein n=1 Tax=Thalassoglobus polymorphus TaxID=2527994 RepID=A0A517QIB4_9PLAN|nr:hypothetical protein Mal48_06040 [Thalassoglobus polymorphus]
MCFSDFEAVKSAMFNAVKSVHREGMSESTARLSVFRHRWLGEHLLIAYSSAQLSNSRC